MIEILGSPFVVFLAALLAGAALYAWGRALAPVLPDTPDKVMPYVGGEPVRGEAPPPNYGFFTVAVFFTLLHLAALVLATFPAGASPWLALVYVLLAAAAVFALRRER
ncbi:MAG: hypothetical protein L6R43_07740 [Planctomycetes bacterium]|nr:hypothetical protein [Planctomycetota bacterium]